MSNILETLKAKPGFDKIKQNRHFITVSLSFSRFRYPIAHINKQLASPVPDQG